MLHTKTPDENGWYWIKIVETGEWMMAFLDVEDEERLIIGREEPGGAIVCPIDRLAGRFGSLEWHGPIGCPGGDIGHTTVIIEEELHQKAKAEGLAICIDHTCGQHCPNPRTASVTVTSLMKLDDALKNTPLERAS